MIEDPKLTLEILKYFARDEISWPANVDDRELTNHFSDISSDKVEYHLYCAIESGLLEGEFKRDAMLDGAFYTFGNLDGLTPEGGEYVQMASSSSRWELIKNRVTEAGLKLTTRTAIQVTKNMIEEKINSIF